MSTLYHYTAVALRPGSVIEPGNWGRMIRRYAYNPQDANGGWRLAFELLMESHRQLHTPALPGRMDSCFAFETLEVAKANENMGRWNVLYEVELVEPSAPSHRADMALISGWSVQDGANFIARVSSIATSYWAGVMGSNAEFLTRSPLRIVRRVQ